MDTIDIFLVRHGEAASSWGQSQDPGLSELGHEQARAAAAALQLSLPEGAVLISSPMARAQQTGAPLAAALSRPVIIDDVFREVPSPVPLEQRQAWLRTFMRQTWEDQDVRQCADLHAWRHAAHDALLALSSPAVVFTHFLVINAVVGHALERTEICHFYPDNGSVTHLQRTADGLQLVTLGRELESLVN